MPKTTDSLFHDDDAEADLNLRVAKLQDIVCYLVHRNEELSQTVRELTSSQPQTQPEIEEA